MKCVVIHANVLWAIVNFRLDLMHFLQKEGFRVVCVADIDDFSTLSMEKLAPYGIEFFKVSIGRKSLNPFMELRYMYTLFCAYQKIKPDIILSYSIKPNIFGNFVARMMGIPVVSTINGLGSGFLGKSWLKWVVKTLYKLALASPRVVFFQNKEDMSIFIKDELVIPHKARYVAGSGINTLYFADCEKKNDGQTAFCLIARLLKDKGVLEYIEAIRLLKKESIDTSKAVFYLGGAFDKGNPSGILEEDVKAWEEEGLVKYLGVTDNIKEFLQRTDVVVLPSYREGLSRVLLEAASAKKAIITTDVAGCRDIVEEGKNGFLVQSHSSGSLCEGFIKMLSLSDASRLAMGESGFAKVQNTFSQDTINTIYLHTIKEVLGHA